MDLGTFLSNYWWLLFWFLPLVYLWIRQKNKDRIEGLTFSDSEFILRLGFVLLLIYLIQHYVFNEHNFFLIGIPIFTLVLFVVIYYLLRGNDIYMLESTILNEKHFDLDNLKLIYSPNTQHRLLIMDKSVYEIKKHVGDAEYHFWSGSPRIKFCDFYDDKTGIFYHPELPQFHNVTIHMARAFLLKAKMDIPKLYRDNIMLTWLSDYKTAYQQSKLTNSFPLQLNAIKRQYDYAPFKLPETIDEIFDEQFSQALHQPIDTEKTIDNVKAEIEKLIAENNKGDSI